MDTQTTVPPVPTNGEVGEKIGLSHSGVSRIRSGDRLPSFGVMAEIERVYGWSKIDQWAARDTGHYAAEFERAIRGEFAA